jgi:cholera toxin transcriptional activator
MATPVPAVALESAADSRASAATAVDNASISEAAATSPRTLLTASHDLPRASRVLVRTLLLLTQAMYLAFYLGALANIPEIEEIFTDARLFSPAILTTLLVITAVVLIPMRLYLSAAVCFDFLQLPAKFRRLFPVLLWLDLLWALSPFLLIHHISVGLALGMTAALVYMPFAQRSLVLMYARDRQDRTG